MQTLRGIVRLQRWKAEEEVEQEQEDQEQEEEEEVEAIVEEGRGQYEWSQEMERQRVRHAPPSAEDFETTGRRDNAAAGDFSPPVNF